MNQDPKDDLQHIRRMMEKSSRFISLSGLSGVLAGLFALAGTAMAWYLLGPGNAGEIPEEISAAVMTQVLFVALIVLLLALGSAIYFTVRKSKKHGLMIWSGVTQNLLSNLFIPLVAGGIFCLVLIWQGYFALVIPSTLVFYGLALVSASSYTFTDVRYLGYCEILLGLIALVVVKYGLIFWGIGFGLLHIFYGLVMYKKYR